MGPYRQAVVNQLVARVTKLEPCEHAPEDFASWIAARPGMLLCEFCYQGGPAPGRGHQVRVLRLASRESR